MVRGGWRTWREVCRELDALVTRLDEARAVLAQLIHLQKCDTFRVSETGSATNQEKHHHFTWLKSCAQKLHGTFFEEEEASEGDAKGALP